MVITDSTLFTDVFFGGDTVANNCIANAVAKSGDSEESASPIETKVRDWRMDKFVLNQKSRSYNCFLFLLNIYHQKNYMPSDFLSRNASFPVTEGTAIQDRLNFAHDVFDKREKH